MLIKLPASTAAQASQQDSMLLYSCDLTTDHDAHRKFVSWPIHRGIYWGASTICAGVPSPALHAHGHPDSFVPCKVLTFFSQESMQSTSCTKTLPHCQRQ